MTTDAPTGPAPVLVWVTEDGWRGCVDAAAALAPAGAPVRLLHVAPEDVPAAAHGAFAGLLGRGHPERDPGWRVEQMTAESAASLLRAAAARLARLGRPCETAERRGRVEREVVAAATGAALLVLARDGDRSRLGPSSLGPVTRFVVDHAPCPVLLIWPGTTPGIATIPPPPHPPGPGPRHHRDDPPPH